jgi:hypothetical protein
MIVKLDEGRAVPWRRIAPEDELVTQLCGIDADGKKLWWVSGEGRDKAALICSTLDARCRCRCRCRSGCPLFGPLDRVE